MTDTFKGFQVTGSEDLISFLKNFAPNIEKKMLDQSVKAATTQGLATPIKKNIRQVVKKRSGNLLKGVKVQKIKGAPPGNYRVFMGPPAYHAWLVENGTVSRRPAFSGSTKSYRGQKVYRPVKFADNDFKMITHTGGTKPRPFFRPGVEDNKLKAGGILTEQLTKKIAAYIVPFKKRKK